MSIIKKIEKNIIFYSTFALRYFRGIWWDVLKPKISRPIFVVGCSRAGTTLVYKTFSRSKELGSLNRETHDLWAELTPLADRDWKSHTVGPEMASTAICRAVSKYFYIYTNRYRFVDKNNQNSLSIAYLNKLFPDAVFVYVKRNPGDNINSLIEGWQKVDLFGTWSEELPEEVLIENGKYRRWCFFLPEGWQEYTTSAIENVCAFQYRSVNQKIMDDLSVIPKSRQVHIKYENILENPVDTFRTAFENTGVVFDTELENHCKTVLLNPYNAFFEIKIDKWKNGKHAGRIENVLDSVSDVADKMGYSKSGNPSAEK